MEVMRQRKKDKKKASSGRVTAGLDPRMLLLRPENAQFAEEIYPDILIEALRAIIMSLEEKDSYTHGHSLRVADYAVALAQELNLSELEVREVELSALFHDIGKIGIPDSVLLKPARLSRAEFEIMKSHPVRSAKILEKISHLANLIPGIRAHHERWDGFGYPDGLKGSEIPLYARIILIADTFDAMTSTRPYRLALDREMAYAELSACAGTQFDPALVEAFLKAMRRQDSGQRPEPPRIIKKIA
jgi:putative nucleotidyltransferase with HDIG domain